MEYFISFKKINILYEIEVGTIWTKSCCLLDDSLRHPTLSFFFSTLERIGIEILIIMYSTKIRTVE